MSTSIKDLSVIDIIKGIVVVVVAVIATTAWMDGRFISVANAKDYVKKEKVDALQRMITYQQLSLVDRDIQLEKGKLRDIQDKERLHILYKQKDELKKELGVK